MCYKSIANLWVIKFRYHEFLKDISFPIERQMRDTQRSLLYFPNAALLPSNEFSGPVVHGSEFSSLIVIQYNIIKHRP